MCPSIDLNTFFRVCCSRGGIEGYRTSLQNRVWQNILSRASAAALRFVHAVSLAMFCPSFPRLTEVGTATAASCNG